MPKISQKITSRIFGSDSKMPKAQTKDEGDPYLK